MNTDQKNISIINKGCRLEGNLDFKGYLIIAGSVQGALQAETVITEEDSFVAAKITADYATIAGFFEGEITTTGTLTLLKTSRVDASIECGTLIIEEGCTFNGRIRNCA